MDKCCATCQNYLIEKKEWSNKYGYWCTFHHNTIAFNELCNHHYKKDYTRSQSDIDKAIKWRVSKGYKEVPYSKRSIFYIITVLSQIIDIDQDFITKGNELRPILFEDSNYSDKVKYYDAYGVVYAKMLMQEFIVDPENTYIYVDAELKPIVMEIEKAFNEDQNYYAIINGFSKLLVNLSYHFKLELDELVIDENYFYNPYEITEDPNYKKCQDIKTRTLTKIEDAN